MSSYCDILKHESEVTSCQLKAWKHQFKSKSTSLDSRVTGSNWQVQDFEMLVRIHELDLNVELRVKSSNSRVKSSNSQIQISNH